MRATVPHMHVDMQRMDCDFMAFSAHKMLGPQESAYCMLRRRFLKDAAFIGGGDMIKEVHKYETRAQRPSA